MKFKKYIISMIAFAAASDAILIPFYPQFFNLRYGIASAAHVGIYVAAISIAVMSALPFWASFARRLEPLKLLMWTQLAAGAFSLASIWAPTVVWYWGLSMLMFMCKSSYLLLYPYLMRLTHKGNHARTVGVISVVMYVGTISGTLAGGFVLQTWGPLGTIMVMAAGDFMQMAVCVYLLCSKIMLSSRTSSASDIGMVSAISEPVVRRVRLPILRLALVMLTFDFGCFVIRPFFSMRWQMISDQGSEIVSSIVFAIPGMLALIALSVNSWVSKRHGRLSGHIGGNLLFGVVGLLMQAASDPALVVVGRCIYGWTVFQIAVKLEVNLFRLSSPKYYAEDYAVMNLFQNFGVLLSSFAAGSIVDLFGFYAPFLVGAAAFILAGVLYRLILKIPSVIHMEEAERRVPRYHIKASNHAN